MLSNTLNTNEIKNAAGTEVEFEHLKSVDRERIFKQITEAPSRPHRLTIKHQETGKGINLRRRSVIRIDKTVMSDVDTTLPVVPSAYVVLDAPVGALTTNTEMANVLAEIMSFFASSGANTTILYDCTGNGADVLLKGGL